MSNQKLAALLKKNQISKSVRANSGYIFSAPYEPELSISYYSHFTAQAVAGLDRVEAALKAAGINYKRETSRIVIL